MKFMGDPIFVALMHVLSEVSVLLIEQPCVLVSYVWMGMWSESQKWLRVCTVCLVCCTRTSIVLSG